jgi:hypothetical protein
MDPGGIQTSPHLENGSNQGFKQIDRSAPQNSEETTAAQGRAEGFYGMEKEAGQDTVLNTVRFAAYPHIRHHKCDDHLTGISKPKAKRTRAMIQPTTAIAPRDLKKKGLTTSKNRQTSEKETPSTISNASEFGCKDKPNPRSRIRQDAKVTTTTVSKVRNSHLQNLRECAVGVLMLPNI